MDCPRCEGTGKCAECGGSGTIVCPTCEGKGQKVSARGTVFDCKSCSGTGKLDCSPLCASCEGKGQITAELQKSVREKYHTRWDDTTPRNRVCLWILLVTIVAFCCQQEPTLNGFIEQYLTNSADGWIHGQVWRLITPIFLHAGFVHIAMNMTMLMTRGPVLEGQLGPWRFLGFYLLAGICGNLFSWLGHFVVMHAELAGIGASTSLFGVGAALVALHYRWSLFGRDEVQNSALFMLGYMLFGFLGWFARIDNWGHLGGFVAGFAYVWLTKRPKGK